jgi:hypothetical protein
MVPRSAAAGSSLRFLSVNGMAAILRFRLHTTAAPPELSPTVGYRFVEVVRLP